MADLGALYLLMENKPAMNREIVYTANSNAQAHLAFDMMSSGLRQVSKVSKSVRDRLKINRTEIIDLPSNSRAVPLASDLHSLDGYQSDLAIIDEFALARNDEILRTLKSGQINSDNSLLAVISTTGPDLNGPMYKEYKFVSQVSGAKASSRLSLSNMAIKYRSACSRPVKTLETNLYSLYSGGHRIGQ